MVLKFDHDSTHSLLKNSTFHCFAVSEIALGIVYYSLAVSQAEGCILKRVTFVGCMRHKEDLFLEY